MTDAFARAVDRLLGHEGGYVNDPHDPGGETHWGISKRAYPTEDIKALTRERAMALYKTDFWDAVHGDDLPYSLAFQVFDFAVNSGVQTALRYLQAAIGVADDGHWGPASQAAAASANEYDAVMTLLAARLEYMTRLQNWPAASRGWARRIAQNLRYGVADVA